MRSIGVSATGSGQRGIRAKVLQQRPSCCRLSDEQHRDPHDEIQPAGGRKTDGGQIIHDHPFASHRRTPFSTKPSSRGDAGRPNKLNFLAALSWTARLLQQRESDALACEAQPLAFEYLAGLGGPFAWPWRAGVSVPSVYPTLERNRSILSVIGGLRLSDGRLWNREKAAFFQELLLLERRTRREVRCI